MDDEDKKRWKEAMKDGGWSDSMIMLQWRDASVKCSKHAESSRDRWWLDAFDASLGFPGEGPGVRPIGADLRVRVQPNTEARYRIRVAELEQWLTEHKLPSLREFVESEQWQAVDSALTAYIQSLHNAGVAISYGTWALAGAQYFYPSIAGHLAR
eukprot:3894557-Amphidinium_carterae.1